jgi:hypothetical protein
VELPPADLEASKPRSHALRIAGSSDAGPKDFPDEGRSIAADREGISRPEAMSRSGALGDELGEGAPSRFSRRSISANSMRRDCLLANDSGPLGTPLASAVTRVTRSSVTR